MDEWDSLLNIEEQFLADGYAAGEEHGKKAGHATGREMGYQRGRELGRELGQYRGRVALLLAVYTAHPNLATDRCVSQTSAIPFLHYRHARV